MVKKPMETAIEFSQAMTNFYMSAWKNPAAGMAATMAVLQGQSKIMMGKSDIAPAAGDKRFRDPIWESNPAYKALMSSYLSWTRSVDEWIDTLDVDARTKMRVHLLVGLISDSASPTNFLLGNPEAIQMTLRQGGKNLLEGAQHMLEDIVHNNGLPSMVDKSKFKVGENLASTPGQVVYREDHLELIQYVPKTEKVFKTPIFIVPPQINKYYIWDLAPGRSVVEFLLEQGHQVFIVSWCNPHEEQSDWGMSSYVNALDRASEVACEISGSKSLNLVGACSGGVTAALLLALWAGQKKDRAKSFTKLVSVLDIEGAKNTTMGLFANFETLELAKMFSRSKGVLEGKDLQKAFAWLRPNDLIWSYWINNYLLGKEPPAFDILYWNADTTNLPAALHDDMVGLMAQGGLRSDGDYEIEGIRIDLSAIKCDKYVIGGATDHITPWEGCYQSMQAFGGENEFILSQSGHIQAIINPPGNPKAKFLTNSGEHSTPEQFKENAELHQGTWWEHWAEWLKKRAGSKKDAPESLGSAKNKTLQAAPGSYVHEEA